MIITQHIVVAMKPIDGNYADNASKHGVSGLNIDDARVGLSSNGRFPANVVLGHLSGCKCMGTKKIAGDKASGLTQTKARSWKNASVAGINRTGYAGADGKETVEEWNCEDRCPVRIMGQQSGHGVSRKGNPRKGKNSNPLKLNHSKEIQVGREYDDSGTAARFFKQVREE